MHLTRKITSQRQNLHVQRDTSLGQELKLSSEQIAPLKLLSQMRQ